MNLKSAAFALMAISRRDSETPALLWGRDRPRWRQLTHCLVKPISSIPRAAYSIRYGGEVFPRRSAHHSDLRLELQPKSPKHLGFSCFRISRDPELRGNPTSPRVEKRGMNGDS